MKRVGNLYQEVISIKNLRSADKKAQLGKKKQYGVIEHNKNREQNIRKLHFKLKNKAYKTSEYFVFKIREPKERTISTLEYFPNRVTHHAVVNIIEPILVKSFISQTYSCLKGRGIHKALRDVNKALRDVEGTKYTLKLDIRKYYPSIDKEILKSILRTKFKDKELFWLLEEIIDSFKGSGIPLGNFCSQIFAHVYLNKFNHWLKEDKKIKYLFIYCDDICIFHSDRVFLHALRREIQEYLRVNLKLELSNYQVFLTESRGIDFVGYVSYHSHIKLRKTIKKKFIKMIKKNKNTKSIASYRGWLLHGDCKHLMKKYL